MNYLPRYMYSTSCSNESLADIFAARLRACPRVWVTQGTYKLADHCHLRPEHTTQIRLQRGWRRKPLSADTYSIRDIVLFSEDIIKLTTVLV